MKTSIKLTVFFDGVFWKGMFERVYEDKYEVSRVVFGAEPKDYEVYDFVMKNFYQLKFSKSISSKETIKKKINPKRLQREIKKETSNKEIGTKAQNALKLEYETHKIERKKTSKKRKEEEKKRKFELKQHKKLMKHRGH